MHLKTCREPESRRPVIKYLLWSLYNITNQLLQRIGIVSEFDDLNHCIIVKSGTLQKWAKIYADQQSVLRHYKDCNIKKAHERIAANVTIITSIDPPGADYRNEKTQRVQISYKYYTMVWIIELVSITIFFYKAADDFFPSAIRIALTTEIKVETILTLQRRTIRVAVLYP